MELPICCIYGITLAIVAYVADVVVVVVLYALDDNVNSFSVVSISLSLSLDGYSKDVNEFVCVW